MAEDLNADAMEATMKYLFLCLMCTLLLACTGNNTQQPLIPDVISATCTTSDTACKAAPSEIKTKVSERYRHCNGKLACVIANRYIDDNGYQWRVIGTTPSIVVKKIESPKVVPTVWRNRGIESVANRTARAL